MAYLMVRHDTPLLLAHDAILLFLTHKDNLYRFKEVLLGYGYPSVLDGQDRSFVDHIRQIRTYSSAGGKGDRFQIYGIVHLHILGMHLQNVHTPFQIGPIHNNPAVKTSRTQKRRIKNLRTVCSSKNQAGCMAVKTVHLSQKLVQCLLTLIVAASVTGITAFSNSVYLVDKDDTGRMLLCLLKQIPDTGSSHTHEHLHKIRTGQGEERHMGFSCHSLCKQCLSGTRRADQKRALGKLRSDLCILARIMKEIHDLLERFLGLFLSCHILKRHSGILLNVDLRLALAYIHPHHAASAAHAAHNQPKDCPKQQNRKQNVDNSRKQNSPEIFHRSLILYIRVRKLLFQIQIRYNSCIISDIPSKSILLCGYDVNPAGTNLHALHLAVIQHIHKFIISDGFAGRSCVSNKIPKQNSHHGNNQEHQNTLTVFGIFIIVSASGWAVRIVVMFFHIFPPCAL